MGARSPTLAILGSATSETYHAELDFPAAQLLCSERQTWSAVAMSSPAMLQAWARLGRNWHPTTWNVDPGQQRQIKCLDDLDDVIVMRSVTGMKIVTTTMIILITIMTNSSWLLEVAFHHSTYDAQCQDPSWLLSRHARTARRRNAMGLSWHWLFELRRLISSEGKNRHLGR